MSDHKIILDLCAGTGSWSRPYQEAGYDVRLVTLPDYDVLNYTPPGNVYGILAAPPCTEFSLAKNSRPRNFQGALNVVNACLNIIRKCRLQNKLKFWAMENPVGYLRQFLGKPHFTFEQWQFGELKIKKTDIWGYFNDPKPTVKARPSDLIYISPKGRYNARDWSKINCPPGIQPSETRSGGLTGYHPSGICTGFFQG